MTIPITNEEYSRDCSALWLAPLAHSFATGLKPKLCYVGCCSASFRQLLIYHP